MLKFDEKKYLNEMNGAFQNNEVLENCADALKQKGFDNIYLIGSGGTVAMASPLEYLLKTYSDYEVHLEIAAELLLIEPKRLNGNSICIFASKSGDTPETVAAAKYCREKGATNIAFVAKGGTPLVAECDYVFINKVEDDNFVDSHTFQTLPFILKLINPAGFDYPSFVAQLKTLPEQLIRIRGQFESEASDFAKRNKDVNYHMLIGSGSLWGVTYGYAMCVLEEMQWIHGKSIHAAEFFHGTLELVEQNTSIILLKGEDETRPLMERAERFVKSISQEVTVLDTKSVTLDGIEEQYRKYLSPLVVNAMLDRISVNLEKERDHSLSLRRYYRQIKY